MISDQTVFIVYSISYLEASKVNLTALLYR